MTRPTWTAPEPEVLSGIGDVLDGEERGVLATVIDVEGSAYRRPGTKMVIPEEGDGLGHVTAGCLEDDLQAIARQVLAAGEPRVETYDLRPEGEDDAWGLGVGCSGVVTILLEPIDESLRPVVEAAETGEDVAVLTVVDAGDGDRIGARAYYDPDGDGFSTDGSFPEQVAGRLREAADDLAKTGEAGSVKLEETTVFVDGIAAPANLVIVGTDHDVGPIADLGAKAGFRVTVIGYRGANADADRFPAADEVRSTSPARIREAFEFDADTYVVVATHNFVDDRITVDELLGETEVPYVGLMGPHERFAEMREAFEEGGRTVSEAELDRLYTPVGLDLGAGSPHGIALSVVGEVLAVRNDREPRHLRDHEGHIHDRVDLASEGE